MLDLQGQTILSAVTGLMTLTIFCRVFSGVKYICQLEILAGYLSSDSQAGWIAVRVKRSFKDWDKGIWRVGAYNLAGGGCRIQVLRLA
jgi:hypothetical protein